MIQKELKITLLPVQKDGKAEEVKVNLAYCYATEIAYKDMANEDITDFMQDAIESIQRKRMPDVKRSIFAILASIMAYSEATGHESQVKDTDLMIRLRPEDLGNLIGCLLEIRAQFYHVPIGEPEDKPEQKKGKKRKNV